MLNKLLEETPTFAETKVPNPLLTHSFASPSLALEVFYHKINEYYLEKLTEQMQDVRNYVGEYEELKVAE